MKKLLSLAAVAVMAFTMAGQAQAAEKLRIATEGAFPPFNYKNADGSLGGLDVDIAHALCKQMKMECTIVAQDWDGIIPALLAHKYDAIVASMSITDERKKSVAFTNKYYDTPTRFAAPKGSFAGMTKENMKTMLKGKVLGVQSSTVQSNYVEDNLEGVVTPRYYDTQEQANLDLESGRVDLLLADSTVLYGSLLNTPAGKDFEFVGPSLSGKDWSGFGDGIGIAVRKQDKDLVKKFNAAIKTIRENGEYLTIVHKYFDFDIYGD